MKKEGLQLCTCSYVSVSYASDNEDVKAKHAALIWPVCYLLHALMYKNPGNQN